MSVSVTGDEEEDADADDGEVDDVDGGGPRRSNKKSNYQSN